MWKGFLCMDCALGIGQIALCVHVCVRVRVCVCVGVHILAPIVQ